MAFGGGRKGPRQPANLRRAARDALNMLAEADPNATQLLGGNTRLLNFKSKKLERRKARQKQRQQRKAAAQPQKQPQKQPTEAKAAKKAADFAKRNSKTANTQVKRRTGAAAPESGPAAKKKADDRGPARSAKATSPQLDEGLSDEDDDDRIIAEMERRLGIKAGQAVGDEGVDYILSYRNDVKSNGGLVDDSEPEEETVDELTAWRQEKKRQQQERKQLAAKGQKMSTLVTNVLRDDDSGEEDGGDDDELIDQDMDEEEEDEGASDTSSQLLAGDDDVEDGTEIDASAEAEDEEELNEEDLDEEDLDENDLDEESLDEDELDEGGAEGPVKEDGAQPPKTAAKSKADGVTVYLPRKGIYGENDVPTQPVVAHAADEAVKASAGSGRYVPPALRRGANAAVSGAPAGIAAGGSDAAAASLRRSVRGLLNRLNEANLGAVVTEMEQLFSRNSRNTMSELITSFVLDACIVAERTLNQLLRVYAACIAALHGLIGMEVSAQFVQTVVQRLHTQHAAQLAAIDKGHSEAAEADKQCVNMVALLGWLYNLRVVHSGLICELLQHFASTLTSVDAELLLEGLRACGAKLRHDDPVLLKALLDAVKDRTRQLTAESELSPRLRFLLDGIDDLRSNRFRVLKDNRELMEPLLKFLRSLARVRGKDLPDPLKVPLVDLIEADKRGRWWLVGAAWSGRGLVGEESTKNASAHSVNGRDGSGAGKGPVKDGQPEPSADLVKLAAQQRMNTDIRRQIFYTVMSSEDYVDCVDKLLHLGLKGRQEQEIQRVLVDCALQQRIYNPYFALVARRLAEGDGNHRLTLQFAIWDKLKMVVDLGTAGTSHLMRLMAYMVAMDVLSLAVLKTIDFVHLDETLVFPLQLFFAILLTHYPEQTVIECFERLGRNAKAAVVKDGILLFLRFYCRDFTTAVMIDKLGETKTSAEARKAHIRERIKLATQACTRVESMFADEL